MNHAQCSFNSRNLVLTVTNLCKVWNGRIWSIHVFEAGLVLISYLIPKQCLSQCFNFTGIVTHYCLRFSLTSEIKRLQENFQTGILYKDYRPVNLLISPCGRLAFFDINIIWKMFFEMQILLHNAGDFAGLRSVFLYLFVDIICIINFSQHFITILK